MSYREAALACSACGEALEPHDVEGAVIDACPACGGIWVDWFDGELVPLVRNAPAPMGGAAGAPQTPRGLQPNSPACPRCRQPLEAERFFETQAEVLRCPECAGAFVPRDAARAIAGADPERKGPREADDALSRLAATLQRWFGWEEKEPG